MKDYLIRGIDKSGKIRVFFAKTTNLVEEARVRHKLSKTASAALGRALTAGILMSSNMKNEQDTLTLNILGNGSLGRILVTCRNNGKIKGYVNNPLADLPTREDGKIDVGGIVGNLGTLTVVMDLGLKKPYIGQVPLISGEIAEDLANYYYLSEQVNSAVALGVLVDRDYSIKSAGGYIIQLLPGANDKDIENIESSIANSLSLTTLLDRGRDLEEIMEGLLPNMEIDILERKDLFYECECSREKVEDGIISMGTEEIGKIIDEDKMAEVICHFCGEKHSFNEEELSILLERAEIENKKSN